MFDVNYFITSLRDEIRILRQLPDEQKRRVKNASIFTMEPHGWSNLAYYFYKVELLGIIVRIIFFSCSYDLCICICLHVGSSHDKREGSLAFQ